VEVGGRRLPERLSLPCLSDEIRRPMDYYCCISSQSFQQGLHPTELLMLHLSKCFLQSHESAQGGRTQPYFQARVVLSCHLQKKFGDDILPTAAAIPGAFSSLRRLEAKTRASITISLRTTQFVSGMPPRLDSRHGFPKPGSASLSTHCVSIPRSSRGSGCRNPEC
jgi:hypothetical protein